MSAPVLCSPPTARWRTGANCWATVLLLPPCSTASSTTDMYSNVVRGVGAQKQTCLPRRRKSKTTESQVPWMLHINGRTLNQLVQEIHLPIRLQPASELASSTLAV